MTTSQAPSGPTNIAEYFRELERTLPEERRAAFAPAVGQLNERELANATQRALDQDGRDDPVRLGELNVHLGKYKWVDRFIGAHLRAAAVANQLTVGHTPLNWHKSDLDFARLAAQVQDVDTHCTANGAHPRRPLSSLYHTMAELEGFTWLLDHGGGHVRALAPVPRRGGGGKTPDARVETDKGPHLYECKSLWAHREARKRHLQPNDRGVYQFGDHRTEPNSRILWGTIDSLLRKARHQFEQYMQREGLVDCRKIVLLVVTRRKAILGVVSTTKDLAQAWVAKHPTAGIEVKVITGTTW